MVRHLKSSSGWRLGWSPDAAQFKGLVGGDDWAIELTEAELKDFQRLVVQLADTLKSMTTELMDEEKISCEVESDLLWLEAEGYPHAYSLRLILRTGRRGEGFWAVSAVPALIQASRVLTTF